jgi:hypothetical protein
MKKYLIMALLALAAAGAFATDWVAGMVLDTVSAWSGGGYSWGSNEYDRYDWSSKDSGGAFGFFGSVGWKYFDLNAAFFWGDATRKVTVVPEGNMSDTEKAQIKKSKGDGEKTATLSALQLGLWFKIPITISRSFRLFPMFGSDFNLGVKYGFGLIPGGGLGADIMLFKNMFLRATVLGGFHAGFTNDLFGFGLSFKVGAGWLL